MSAEISPIADVESMLDQSAELLPVYEGAGEERRWQDHDLASLVENRLGALVDPTQISDADRSAWHVRATFDIVHARASRFVDQARYWIMHQGRRIGTIAVAVSPFGDPTLSVSSLYVLPSHRRLGHARRALDAVHGAAVAVGLSGLRLFTEWSWQPAVRFYMDLGMWVRGWKHAIDFVRRAELPPWRVRLAGDRAVFELLTGGAWQAAIEARRNGERLDWIPLRDPDGGGQAELYGEGTFALALALRGFPLITSDQAWQRQIELGFSDRGGPEGLAFKIPRFEAWDRKHGWRTPAPRIPGLAYPDWDAFE